MFRHITAGLAVAVGIGSMVYAQEPVNDSSAAPDAPAITQTVQATESETKSPEEQLAELKGKLDGLDEPLAATKSTVDKLSKIKISGYAQFQVRSAVNYKDATDTTGTGKSYGTYKFPVGDFAGGKFGDRMGSVIQLRRARIKVAYESDLSQAVVQFDCVPFSLGNAATAVTSTFDTVTKKVTNTYTNSAYLSGGGVTIKDAFLRFTEPWLKSFAIKGGVFDRPFGFEISYSSSNRESPERSRLFQTLFPGERDLGVSLEYLPSDKISGLAQYLNLKFGAFTGNGINVETDNNRDYIGRLGVSIPITSVNMGIDAGFSGYAGKVLDLNDTVYEITSNSFVGKAGQKNKTLDRQYTGGDIQFYYGDVPVLGGLTLRGEVITGKQPGVKASTGSPSNNIASTAAVYLRNFTGYYGMLVQNIDPLKSQLVLKYDVYDPNSDCSGNTITAASEMMFSTLGLGLVYHWDENVKLVAYYDMVKNEKINLAPYTTDIKDDVFTFRIQYKF